MEKPPLSFCDIEVKGKIAKARAYVYGLGLYEVGINNTKVSDEHLSPGLTVYDKWIPYQTHDITVLLVEGCNHLEVLLGNG